MREHVCVVGGGQQRVDDDGHDTGQQCAEEANGKIGAVEQREQDAFFRVDALRMEDRSELARTLFQLGVGRYPSIVDVRGLDGSRPI